MSVHVSIFTQLLIIHHAVLEKNKQTSRLPFQQLYISESELPFWVISVLTDNSNDFFFASLFYQSLSVINNSGKRRRIVSFLKNFGARTSFDARRVTRFPPIGKRISVGKYNNSGQLPVHQFNFAFSCLKFAFSFLQLHRK